MGPRGLITLWGGFLAGLLLTSGCARLGQLAGLPAEGTPAVSLRRPRWVLAENPRYGDVPSEPQYIWVEDDSIPWSLKRLLFGKRAVLAPPEIVGQFGSPPGGGKVSPLQGTPYAVEDRSDRRRGPPAPAGGGAGPTPNATSLPTRGYVVFVDADRVVIDLAVADGLTPGSAVSIRRGKISVVHPVTGELLGELDYEVARVVVVEVRARFSVARIQSLTSGAQIKVGDRVIRP